MIKFVGIIPLSISICPELQLSWKVGHWALLVCSSGALEEEQLRGEAHLAVVQSGGWADGSQGLPAGQTQEGFGEVG
jgi:hypothetical protein